MMKINVALVCTPIALYRRGLFPIDRLIKLHPIEKINEAFADGKSGRTIKPVPVMPGFEYALSQPSIH